MGYICVFLVIPVFESFKVYDIGAYQFFVSYEFVFIFLLLLFLLILFGAMQNFGFHILKEKLYVIWPEDKLCKLQVSTEK